MIPSTPAPSRRWALALAAALGLAAACDTTYEFDPTTAGDPDTVGHPRISKTSSQFVRGIYADLLSRAPSRYDQLITLGDGTQLRNPIDEERNLDDLLDGVADPGPLRALIVRGVLESPEAAVPSKEAVTDPPAWIRDRFRRYLGREPNAYELAAFVDAWHTDPAVGPRAVIRALLASREYQSR
ncbi:MAG TPA: hypothetical protein VHE35_37040 [Kofleriaceae bacterium]|nr:hypothetical protein [Kofleriaceae bacterium]